MKHIEKIKFWLGLLLLAFAIFAGVKYILEGYAYFQESSGLGFRYIRMSRSQGPQGSIVALNTPFFFGLCAIAGAWLITSVKKTDI